MSIAANHDPGAPNPSFETPRPFDPGPRRRDAWRPDVCDRYWCLLHEFIERTRGRYDHQVVRNTGVWFEGLGFWPIVIAPGGKSPLMKEWNRKAPTSQVWDWAARKNLEVNVALMLGAAGGLVDLDVDEPEAAEPTLQTLFPLGVPNTLGWSTRRGYHLLFRYEPGLSLFPKSIVRLPGVELKIGHPEGDSRRLHAVIPPSRMADGVVRTWNDGRGIHPLPDETLSAIAAQAPRGFGSGRCAAAAEDGQKRKVGGGRRGRGARPGPEERARMYLARCDPAVAGKAGHNAAFKAACKIGPGFELPQEVALRLLLEHFNPRCEPPWSEAELRHKVADAYHAEHRRGWLLGASRQ